jgi:hypothetical protein
MKAVDTHLEGVKPLFDEVSVGVVDLTAQPKASKRSPIAELIDEKHGGLEIVFLGEVGQKRICWIGTVMTKQRDIENQLCVEVYCSIQPRPLTVNFDSGFVDRDPRRLRRRRVRNAVSNSMYPVPNGPVRAFDA